VIDRFARFIVSRNAAWATVVLVLTLAGISLAFSRQVKHEDDVLAFLPRGNPEVSAFYDVNKRFGGLDVGMVGIAADDVFASDFLKRLQKLTYELKETQGLSQVLSLANVLDFAPDREHGGIITSTLIDKIPTTDADRQALRNLVMSRDHVVGNLVSADGKGVLIYCFYAYGTDPKTMSSRIQSQINAAFPNHQKYFGGNPFISSYIYNTTQEDMRRLTPWAGLVIVVIMMIAFRDVFATVLALVSTGIGIVFSLGLMGALGIRFNLVLGSMPIIMLALGSAYAIHILARYYALAQDHDVQTAIRRTLTSVGPAVLAAGLTTVASLLSFVCMDIQPMRIFGIFTAVGLFAKLILSVTFIPAVVRLANLKRRPSSPLLIRRAMAGLAVFARTHRFAVASVLVALAIGGALTLSRVDTSMDQTNFYSPGSPPDRAEKYLRASFGGSEFIQIQITGDMTDPQVLREIQRVADEMLQRPHVSQVMHVGQAIAQVNESMAGQRRIPDTTEQVKLLYTFISGDPAIRQMVSDDRQQALLQIKLDTNRAVETEGLLADIERWAKSEPIQRFTVVSRQSPRGAEVKARLEQISAQRIAGASRFFNVRFDRDTADRVGRFFSAPVGATDPKPVQAGLIRFLRSDECTGRIPPVEGDKDPARDVAAALVALGPSFTQAGLAPAIAKGLGRDEKDSLVDDVALSVGTPLRELWSGQAATQRATSLVQAAGLTLPTGDKGQRFIGTLAAALFDTNAPAALLPAPAGQGSVLGLQVTGMPVLNRGLARSVMQNQIRSLIFAFILVLTIMSLLFRSLWVGLTAAVPAGLTVLIIYGGMGVLGVHLDIGTCMLASIIVGAGVDYAIHLLAAWRAPADGSMVEAARTGGDHAGLAVWCNAVMVAAGFFILTLGEAKPLHSVGGLTSAAMIGAAVVTFLAIPVLARRRQYSRVETDPLPEDSEVAEVVKVDR
jgi:uncharacterized protein